MISYSWTPLPTSIWPLLSLKELPQGTFAASSLSFAANINPWITDNVNFAQLANVQAVYYPAKREVHFTIPLLGSNVPNARLVVDYNRPDIVRFRQSQRATDASMWMRKDANSVMRPMVGDTVGNVWYLIRSFALLELTDIYRSSKQAMKISEL